MWLLSLVLLLKVLVPSLPLPEAVRSRGAALDGASSLWLRQHRAGSSSSGSPCFVGRDNFGAWQAVGAESSADLGGLEPAIKIHSLSYSFTGWHRRDESTLFCLKRLFSWGIYFIQASRLVCLGLAHVIVKNPEKQLFLCVFLLFIVCEEIIVFQMKTKTISLRKSCRDFFLLSFRSTIKKKSLLPEKQTTRIKPFYHHV